MLKFYLRSRSFGLHARMFHGEQHLVNKPCKLCLQGVKDNEKHYLLDCPTFLPERAEFARLLLLNMQVDFGQELAEIRIASKSKQVAYILGRIEPHWNAQVAELIDRLFRPYVTALATKRKYVMKGR
jgi:hypothetical protein